MMRQKVGKERSQEGCAPLANPRHFLACPLRKFGPSPTPLRLCKTPVGVPSGTAEDGDSASRYFLRPRLSRELTITGRTPGGNATSPDEGRSQPWGGGWPERPYGSQLSYWPTNSRAPAPKNRSAQRSWAARLGDSFYFAKCEIVESLLRRGARGYSQKTVIVCALAEIDQTTESCLVNFLLQQSRGAARHANRACRVQTTSTALKPRGLRLRRGGAPIGRFTGHSGEKTVSARAPAKSYSNAYSAFERFRYFRRGARVLSLHFATQTQQKPLWGRSVLESWSRLSNKLRLPYAGGGPTKAKRTPAKHPTGAPGRRTLRVFYWPAGGKLLRLRSRAGPPTKTPTKAPTGPRGEPAMLRIAGAHPEKKAKNQPKAPYTSAASDASVSAVA